MPGGWELLIILFVILLLFGSTRLPQLAKGMGKSIKEFKKGINDGEDDADDPDAARRREQLRTGDTARVRDDERARDDLGVNRPR